MRVFILTATLLMFATLACADLREEAMGALSALRQSRFAQTQPDEMRSIDSVFSIAENYFRNSDYPTSARYYLLTIQKIKVLKIALKSTEVEPAPQSDKHPLPPQLAPNVKLVPPPMSAPVPDDIQRNKPASDSDFPAAEQQNGTKPLPAKAQTSEETDDEEQLSAGIIGNASAYTVTRNDTLSLVAAKLGVSRQHLAMMNRLDSKAGLKVGQKLKYNNRKIIPQRLENGIIINIPDLTLYYFRQGKLAVSMPVALGTANKNKKHNWKTPTGKFRIIAKQKNPTWFIPHSIRSEMENLGKEVNSSIPPGPENPLGKYALKTTLPGILIHSTTRPGSIYSFASHGCIRVSPVRMEELFKNLKLNTPGEIIYRPIKLAVTTGGRIFLEVHQDFYGVSPGLGDKAKLMIEKHNLSDRVDWKKVESVIMRKEGVAKDVTL